MMPSSMSIQESHEMTPEESMAFLEEIWVTDDGVQDVMTQKEWDAFIKNVKHTK